MKDSTYELDSTHYSSDFCTNLTSSPLMSQQSPRNGASYVGRYEDDTKVLR